MRTKISQKLEVCNGPKTDAIENRIFVNSKHLFGVQIGGCRFYCSLFSEKESIISLQNCFIFWKSDLHKMSFLSFSIHIRAKCHAEALREPTMHRPACLSSDLPPMEAHAAV